MTKNILIISAHPEPASLTQQFAQISIETLHKQGHKVMISDLYAMNWPAVFGEEDFPARTDPQQLSFIAESRHAWATGQQRADVALEQQKLLLADAVIIHFPLWWYGMPAILKGWVDRVYAYGFAYGYQDQGNQFRYGDGILKGKRAILSVMVGGPDVDYSPRGINGPLDQLLFPITHGVLFYPGMEVLPTHAVYGTAGISAEEVETAKAGWRTRLNNLFTATPIPFRRQNGGDYPDRHHLAPHLALGQSGLMAHIAESQK